MKRWWFAAVLLMAATAQSAADPDAILQFNAHYEPLFRKYFGCPLRATSIKECRPGQGTLDLKEFRASCQAARLLFDLKGACQ